MLKFILAGLSYLPNDNYNFLTIVDNVAQNDAHLF